MASIRMPVTPRSAYDPQRPANALLLTHVRELEKAVVAAGRKVRRKHPKTEEQVAAYVRHLNRALYHQTLLPPMKRRPLDVPIDDLVPAARGTSSQRSSRQPAKTSASRRKKALRSRKSRRGRRS
jgi:hypothetical protein